MFLLLLLLRLVVKFWKQYFRLYWERQIKYRSLSNLFHSRLHLLHVFFLSQRRTLKLSILIPWSNTEASNLDPQMPMTAALIDFTIKGSSLSFNNKPLIFRWMKCKSFFLKMFDSFEHCTVYLETAPGFKLILPESDNNNSQDEYKFLNFTLKIEKWFMVNWVINETIFSQASMLSNVKNSCLLQLLAASLWSGVLICLYKKATKEQLKCQTSKLCVTSVIEANVPA